MAHGLLRCIEACVALRGVAVAGAGLRVAVQGAGSFGAAVTRRLSATGARLIVGDAGILGHRLFDINRVFA